MTDTPSDDDLDLFGSDEPAFSPELNAVSDRTPEPDAYRPGEPVDSFADLTLWDVLVHGLRAPRATWRAFWDTIQTDGAPDRSDGPQVVAVPTVSVAAARSLGAGWRDRLDRRMLPSLVIMAGGLLLALVGSAVMASGTIRSEVAELNAGLPWLLAGFVAWLIAGGLLSRESLVGWAMRLSWRPGRVEPVRSGESASAEAVEVESLAPLAAPPSGFYREAEAEGFHFPPERVRLWMEAHAPRLFLAGLAVLLSLAAYEFNRNNTFTGFGVFVWISGVLAWLMVLTPADFDLRAWVSARRAQWADLFRGELRLRLSWTAAALIVIMIVAAAFRFANFEAAPPEMTSDHVEKLLDAQRVLDGTYQVFFPNNGGREGLQMYLVALFSRLSGLGMQFATLKWVSVLEGLLTIPALWWMGRQLIGEEDEPELANAVGLILAALVAVSYWHVALSRLALRIVLTPLIMALVAGYLARAMRHNRRGDYLKAGVALGVGLYCYQAVRMIPVIVVLGVGMAFLFRARTWLERRRYLLNFVALVLVALAIFAPLGRFMVEFPDLFWMRTAGRLLGDDVITETNPVTGELIQRNATLQDRIDAFNRNLPVLGSNIRNALLMYNWKGDVAWINGAPNEPAMDVITGSLLIVGLAAWIVRLFRRGDVADWLVLPAVFIMLLPSALSIAFPVENPSATRTSGTLPLVYLIAAYGAALLIRQFERAFKGRWTRPISVAFVVAMVWGALAYNSNLYFGEYVERYAAAAQPYSVAGRVLRGFAESNGSYGNAFMVAYPYWFDHRAIGIEGGVIDWPNGLVSLDDLRQRLRDNLTDPRYAFDPNRAVMFFYSTQDTLTPGVLQQWFPQGNAYLQRTISPVKDFYTYVAPPPGEAWLRAFLDAPASAPETGSDD